MTAIGPHSAPTIGSTIGHHYRSPLSVVAINHHYQRIIVTSVTIHHHWQHIRVQRLVKRTWGEIQSNATSMQHLKSLVSAPMLSRSTQTVRACSELMHNNTLKRNSANPNF